MSIQRSVRSLHRVPEAYASTYWANQIIGINGNTPIPRVEQDPEPEWDTAAWRIRQAREDHDIQMRQAAERNRKHEEKRRRERNAEILRKHNGGATYAQLGREHKLSRETVKQIVYAELKSRRT